MTETKTKRKVTKGLEFYYSSFWRELRDATLQRDKFRCQYCGGRATSADHIKPRRRGGKDELSNLRAICKTCNEFFEGRNFQTYRDKLNYYLDNHDLDGNPIERRLLDPEWDYGNYDPTDTTNLPF